MPLRHGVQWAIAPLEGDILPDEELFFAPASSQAFRDYASYLEHRVP
jgi:hypothetical protein